MQNECSQFKDSSLLGKDGKFLRACMSSHPSVFCVHCHKHIRCCLQSCTRNPFKHNYICILDFKLSPCFICNMFSFKCFPGVWVLIADVSEPSIGSIFIGRSMQYDRGWDVWGIYTRKTPKKKHINYICSLNQHIFSWSQLHVSTIYVYHQGGHQTENKYTVLWLCLSEFLTYLWTFKNIMGMNYHRNDVTFIHSLRWPSSYDMAARYFTLFYVVFT
jgi:hypothetical protein